MNELQPGRYKLAAKDYHADPCPRPSLSSTIAKILLKESPLHAWHNHPRLNTKITPRQATFMDIGSVAHELLLQDGSRTVVIDAPDYRTKAAQDAKAKAYAEGKVPILSKHYVGAQAMVVTAITYLRECFGNRTVKAMLKDPANHTEQALIWQDQSSHPGAAPVWCRSMVDWLQEDGTIVDYKTTATSVRSDNIERHLFAMDYHVQNAFYERGMDRLFPDGAGHRRFLFLFQEVTPPFACQLIRVDEGALHIARRMVHEAIDDWSWCLDNGQWPSYPARACTVMMPNWQTDKWMRHEEEAPAGGFALPDYFSAG